MVTPDTTFVGFDAIDRVLASGVDVVLLATPPGFRPYHLRKCVEAGKHVFAEKPMATDAPGVRMVLEAAAVAKQKRLALTSGFCWRYNPAERQIADARHRCENHGIRDLNGADVDGRKPRHGLEIVCLKKWQQT